MTANPHHLLLDAAAQAFLEATATRPPIERLGLVAARMAFDELQDAATSEAAAEEWVTIDAAGFGSIGARIVRGTTRVAPLPVVVYLHGGGWVSGNAHTHDRLVRELAAQSGAAVLFPDYALAPGNRYPCALEQVYATVRWIASDGQRHGLDPSRIAVAGDSEGANLAIALVLQSLQRNEFRFEQLVALTPVVDAACDSASYRQFANGYHTTREDMRWFWDQYILDPRQRTEVTACPLSAELADLAQFPPTLLITAEADVVRDEGEAFAARMRLAGAVTTAVRYEGTIHDFVVLDALRHSSAARAATAQAASALAGALGTVGPARPQ